MASTVLSAASARPVLPPNLSTFSGHWYTQRHTGLHGEVVRAEKVGGLRLTETAYTPLLQLPIHQHESALFGLVLEGTLLEETPAGLLSCPRGSVFYCAAMLPHRCAMNKKGARCFYIEVSAGWLEHAIGSKTFSRPFVICQDSRVGLLARKIHMEWRENRILSAIMIEGLTGQLAAELFRSSQFAMTCQPPTWLGRVFELVHTGFAGPLSLSALSDEVGLHRVHIASRFRRFYGTTIGDYIRHRRVEFACEKLLDPEVSTIEVALEAGFAHQPHFTTVFRKIMGMTPGEYRYAMGVHHRSRRNSPSHRKLED